MNQKKFIKKTKQTETQKLLSLYRLQANLPFSLTESAGTVIRVEERNFDFLFCCFLI